MSLSLPSLLRLDFFFLLCFFSSPFPSASARGLVSVSDPSSSVSWLDFERRCFSFSLFPFSFRLTDVDFLSSLEDFFFFFSAPPVPSSSFSSFGFRFRFVDFAATSES